jgi:hypothetical protein
MTSTLQYNSLFDTYLNFERLKPNESVKTYESITSKAYHDFVNSILKSQE